MNKTEKPCRISLNPDEYADIERIAAGRNMTVEQWIADAARQAKANHDQHSERIMQATEKAMQSQHPTADIDQMLAEIEAGYLSYTL